MRELGRSRSQADEPNGQHRPEHVSARTLRERMSFASILIEKHRYGVGRWMSVCTVGVTGQC